MKDMLVPIIITIIGSNAFFGFIQFLISRKDSNNERFKSIEDKMTSIDNKINYIDQGGVRQQIMLLIHLYPQRDEEIIKLAKKYFIDFKGNYYLTTIFKQYLDDNNLTYPQWFIQYKNNK